MWIKRYQVRNVGPHRSLDLTFQRGLCAIIGPNGSGKSYVMDGVHACLTNDYTRFDGVKDDNICDLSSPDDESWHLVVGEHNDVEFEVFRRLRRAASDKGRRGLRSDNELVVGGKTYTKDPDIRRELQEKLGVNFDLLSDYVFVQQWHMFDFISQTTGERAAAFQTMCGTQKAERIYDAVEALLSQSPEMTTEVYDNSDEINQQISTGELALAQAREELALLEKLLLSPQKLEAAQRLLKRHEAWERAEAQLPDAEVKVAARRLDLDAALKAKTAAANDVTAAEAEVAELKPAADEAAAALKDVARHTMAVARRKTLTERRDKFKAEYERLSGVDTKTLYKPIPAPHPRELELDTLKGTRAALQAQYDDDLDVSDTFARDGVVECPTCGTPVTTLDEHLRTIRERIPQEKQQLDELTAVIEAIRTMQNAVVTLTLKRDQVLGVHEAGLREAKSQLDKVEAELQGIAVTEPPPGDEVTWRKAVADHDAARRRLADLQLNRGDVERRFTKAETVMVSVRDRCAELTKERDENVVKPEVLANVKAALKQHDEARIQVAAKGQAVQSLGDTVNTLREELERVQARLARSRKALAFAARMNAIRDDVMHRCALPARVAQTNLQDMEADINAELDTFGSPYWVEAGEDLTLSVHFPGAPTRPAARLSGGQRGVLAMAFRSTILSLFAANVGMLALDEPTAGMDEVNVGFLADAMAKYAAVIRGRRQVLVITHHADELRRAFDQVIELGKTA